MKGRRDMSGDGQTSTMRSARRGPASGRTARWTVAWAAALLMVLPAAVAWGQRDPRIGYVYPAGGKQGTTFEVTVGGQFLDGASEVRITGPNGSAGVKAVVAEYQRPLNGQQAQLLRDRMRELQAKRMGFAYDEPPRGKGAATRALLEKATTRPAREPFTAADEAELESIRKKLMNFVQRPSTPALAEQARVTVTIAADAEPGVRELRLRTQLGMTNPLTFCVGQVPEYAQEAAKVSKEAIAAVPGREMEATIPAVFNGQILAGGVDQWKFRARAGQHLVAAVSARALMPYLADAVPGWFQATLGLYDERGIEVAYCDDFRFNPDPVIYYVVPRDGEYTLEIKDSIYRGREDFVYRIEVGELPYLTGIWPLGCRKGEQASVEVKGWNLVQTRVQVDAREKAAAVYPVTTKKGGVTSNAEPFAVDDLPETMEKEPNNRPGEAQEVSIPVIVNGRIDKPGDVDVYSFKGKAGDEVVAEVMGRRLNSPVDSELRLCDESGKEIAYNDDHVDQSAALLTHQADSWLKATLPANGTYYLHMADAQHKGGSEYAYRLRISTPRPDFELRVTPSNVNVRAGATVPVTVHAIRRDGFDGEIKLALKDAEGFKLGGGKVPAGQDSARVTLTAPPGGASDPVVMKLTGRALIGETAVEHEAVPADDMMQAFYYHHLVPAREWTATVLGRAPFRRALAGGAGAAEVKQVRLVPGGEARVRVAVPGEKIGAKVELELSGAPEGITLKDVKMGMDGSELVLACDSKVKVGLQGNLIIEIFAERTFQGPLAKPGNSGITTQPATTRPAVRPAANQKRRVSLGTLAAVPFEVVKKAEGVGNAQ